MTEPIGEPTPEPDSELDDAAINELADDAPADMRTVRRMRAENRKLRHRLRESEANRQTAEEGRASDLARLAAYEKDAIERAASTVLVDPEDIWRHTDEVTQAEFNDAFGGVVADRVVESAKRLATERPHLARHDIGRPPTDQPIEGLRPGASPEPKAQPATWYGALHG